MLSLMLLGQAWAGGGPLNVMVLYNADVPEASAVAAYYAEQRDLPAGHTCGISGLGETETAISWDTYAAVVLPTLDACLAALATPEIVDVLVVVRGLPYRVELASYTTSLSAMLQVYRAATTSGIQLAGTDITGAAFVENPWYDEYRSTADYTVANDYALWYTSAPAVARADAQPEPFFREARVSWSSVDFRGNLFIVTRLDGFDYSDAYALIDRGVAADGTFPAAPMLCMHGADSARGARDPECEYVTRLLGGLGQDSLWLDTFDGALAGYEVAAYFTGAASMTGAIDGLTYAPGAITDNLTSYGAVPSNFFCSTDGTTCPGSESQTSVARFVRAGATGAHGTVNEPYNNVFPNASALLYYAMGYSLGESYFFSQRYLYWQNLTLGDPLTTPYAERPAVSLGPTASALPVDRPLTLSATHPDGVRAVRLYADGALVAEAEGDSLDWLPADSGFSPGEQPTLYAIAEAADVELAPLPGWPHSGTTVRARTQGWTSLSLTLAEPLGPADDTGAPDEADPPGGGSGGEKTGGCATAPGSARALLAGLLLLGLAGRRRRRAA